MSPGEVAAEHIAWAHFTAGMTPGEVCASVGIRIPRATWEDAYQVIRGAEVAARRRNTAAQVIPLRRAAG